MAMETNLEGRFSKTPQKIASLVVLHIAWTVDSFNVSLLVNGQNSDIVQILGYWLLSLFLIKFQQSGNYVGSC